MSKLEGIMNNVVYKNKECFVEKHGKNKNLLYCVYVPRITHSVLDSAYYCLDLAKSRCEHLAEFMQQNPKWLPKYQPICSTQNEGWEL